MNVIGKSVVAVVCCVCGSIIDYDCNDIETIEVGDIYVRRIKCPECGKRIEPLYSKKVALIKVNEPGKYITF